MQGATAKAKKELRAKELAELKVRTSLLMV